MLGLKTYGRASFFRRRPTRNSWIEVGIPLRNFDMNEEEQ